MFTKRLLLPCSKDAQPSLCTDSCHNVAPGPFVHSLLVLSDTFRWDRRMWPSHCCFWATLSPRSCVQAGPGWDELSTMKLILSAGGHCPAFFVGNIPSVFASSRALCAFCLPRARCEQGSGHRISFPGCTYSWLSFTPLSLVNSSSWGNCFWCGKGMTVRDTLPGFLNHFLSCFQLWEYKSQSLSGRDIQFLLTCKYF